MDNKKGAVFVTSRLLLDSYFTKDIDMQMRNRDVVVELVVNLSGFIFY